MQCCGCTSAAVMGLFASQRVREERQAGEVRASFSGCASEPRRHTRRTTTLPGRGSSSRVSLASLLGGQLSFHTAFSRLSTTDDQDVEELAREAQELEELKSAELEKARDLRERFPAEAADPRVARWFEDNDILRYIRARQELDDAEALLRKAVSWRKDQEGAWNVPLTNGSFGSLYGKYSDNVDEAPDWWAFLHQYTHATIYGEDNFGAPITYVHFGAFDLQGCSREVGTERITQYMVYLNDYFIDCARDAYRENREDTDTQNKLDAVHGGIVILDMEGLAWRHKGDIGIFGAPGEVTKFLHPERQRRSFIVRAPRIFSICWRLISPMIDARAREKMRILSSGESLDPLIEEIGEALLPTCLGGSMADLPSRPSGLVPEGGFARFQQERARRLGQQHPGSPAQRPGTPAAEAVRSAAAVEGRAADESGPPMSAQLTEDIENLADQNGSIAALLSKCTRRQGAATLPLAATELLPA